jgi:hypothetical protein
MGRKGTNKSKSKKNKSPKDNSVNLPSKGNPPGQLLVKNNEATHNKDGSVLNSWEKRNKKGRLVP